MTYPLISEYVAAIQNAADNLDKVSGLKPVMDSHGEPVHSSGAFAVVFKMVDENGKYFALKCFTEEQTGRDEAYRLIAEELDGIESKYLTSVRYYEKELFVDSNVSDETEFPVLLMDWIEGETMDVYIAENYQDQSATEWLCYRFCKMASWLRSQPFAHGDIKPDNIIVNEDGELTLIDYDGMFVPAMKGWKSPTLGTKDFVHPNRKIEDFDETIDDFTLSSIALSLKAISLDSSLYDKFGAADRLLFSAEDYLNLGKSEVVAALLPLMSNIELMQLESLFKYALAAGNLSSVSFRTFVTTKPDIITKSENIQALPLTAEEIAELCKVTDEELDSVDWDETGAKYSKDGKRLLKIKEDCEGEFIIKKGTKIICNEAASDGLFLGCSSLTSITIPSSVTSIGDSAFSGCSNLTSITIPTSVTSIANGAFCGCSSLMTISIPSSVTSIGDNAFSGCSNLTSITIPTSVTSIANGTFCGCSNLMTISIPSSVTSIGNSAFSGCSNLTLITIPSRVTDISDSAFSGCSSLTSITIPSRVTSIGDNAFSGCFNLTSIAMPSMVTSIGRLAFRGCSRLTSISIPSSVTIIGNRAFEHCSSLTSISIPSNVTSISDGTFFSCEGLTSITIPSSVTSIGAGAFKYCFSLASITIPSSVTSIGTEAFDGCFNLTSITIPSSVTRISLAAFYGCSNLKSITILSSVTSIIDYAFYGCSSLTSINIPFGTKQHFMNMLPIELHSKLIEK